MLHVGIDAEQVRRFDRIVQCGRFHPRILQTLDATAASALAGVALQHPCLHFPLSGWLAPAALCEFYVRHAGIDLRVNSAVQSLTRHHDTWRVELLDGSAIDTTHVVLCNAAEAYVFPQCRQLPLISNRGQVDVYAGTTTTDVRTILCGQGYLTPVSDGLQSLGGSYYVERTSVEQNRATHLALLSRMDRQLAEDLAQRRPLQQRVGQRCQTPDRMPLAGLVSAHYPGLYINAAHGSNGLARTPISAALLASLLNGTPSPLSDTMCSLVNPERFSQRI
jgi:tRNA 5-methylaminomethyl-2-thiouridine biosynthesis bifunctional protein